jgi:hypothetical protein
MPRIKTLHLRLRPDFIHRLDDLDNLGKRIGKDEFKNEALFCRIVFRVVHGAHIKSAQRWFNGSYMGYFLLGSNANRSCGKIDDNRAGSRHRVVDILIILHLIARQAIPGPRVDVHCGCSRVIRSFRFCCVFFGGVRDAWTLSPIRDDA